MLNPALSDPAGFNGLICRGDFTKDLYSSARVALQVTLPEGEVVMEKYILLPVPSSQTTGSFLVGLSPMFWDVHPDARVQGMPAGSYPSITCTVDSSMTLVRQSP